MPSLTVVFRLAGGRTFFLLRQEESSQRRRRPRVMRSAAPTSLRYSKPAGAAELGLRPQTVLAPFPPASALLGASHRDPERRRRRTGGIRLVVIGYFWLFLTVDRKKLEFPGQSRLAMTPFGAPWGALSNAGGPGAVGLPCLSRRRVQASRPDHRVAQGTRRAPTLGSPFLCLLSFGEAKESKTPARRNTAVKQRTPAYHSGRRNSSSIHARALPTLSLNSGPTRTSPNNSPSPSRAPSTA